MDCGVDCGVNMMWAIMWGHGRDYDVDHSVVSGCVVVTVHSPQVHYDVDLVLSGPGVPQGSTGPGDSNLWPLRKVPFHSEKPWDLIKKKGPGPTVNLSP